MKRTWIALLLVMSLLFSYAVPVFASDASTKVADYADAVNERFGTFNRDGYLRALLDNESYSSYLCYQKIETAPVGNKLAGAALWVLDEDLDTHHWIGHLATLMRMQEIGFGESAANMAEYDSLKSLEAYASDLIDIAGGLIPLSKYSPDIQKFMRSEFNQLDGFLDITFSSIEEYQYVLAVARNYSNHLNLLNTIRTYAEDKALKEAAEYLIDVTHIASDLQLDYLRDTGIDAFQYLQTTMFTPEMLEEVKNTREYARGGFDTALVDWFENTLDLLDEAALLGKGAFTGGIFFGDMVFGTTDTFKRYAELKANLILLETLQRAYGAVSDWGETAEENIKWIPEAVPLLQVITLLRMRGEYVNLSLVTEDAQAMSLWQELCGKADVYREYYSWQEERLSVIWEDLCEILMYEPFEDYELEFEGGDYFERDLDGDGEEDILSCYQDGNETVVAIATSLGGQIEYRALSMMPRGTLVGVNLGDGTVTLIICVATGMAGGASSVYCPVYRLIEEEYVQIYDAIETFGIYGTADSTGSNATVGSSYFGYELTGAITPPFSELADKDIYADPIYSVSFELNPMSRRKEIVTYQYLWCYYHMAGIGSLETHFELDDGKLYPVSQTVNFYAETDNG
ncbi:MAG: hypothetical protein IJP11_00770 [Oscillospiraceae bacterium]|nr:hypothetical protein [Oscillospiraceae bacterium]